MEKLINEKEVYEIVGFKQSKLRHMIIAGEFPKPLKFGNRNRWKQSVVHKWVEELQAV
jgi:predicted DNA-binding transcriptional regulator AlpA